MDDIASEPESEEGGRVKVDSDGEEIPMSSPKKQTPKKKKKVTSAGMQIPEHWPWEEAKKVFLNPDVVKGEDLDVGLLQRGDIVADAQLEWKAPDTEGLVEFLCRDKGFK